MSRKVSAVMTGWLAAASIGLAQSGQPSGPAAGKGQTMSPYYATASTMDRSGQTAELPEMPNIPVPRAPAPARTVVPVQATQPTTPPATPATKPPATLPPTTAPSVTSQPPVASRPTTGAANSVAACPSGNCGTCTTCDPCGPNGPCGPQGRVWGSAEYLLWWTSGMNVPALVTGSPAGTPRAQAGVIGAPGTAILFGNNNDINDSIRSGLRVRGGFWLDQCLTCGLDGSFFFLGRESQNESFGSPTGGTGILARPFYNASPTASATAPFSDSELIAFPGVLNGAVTVNATTELYGFDANFRKNLRCGCDYRIDGLVGYRYLRLEDSVTATEDLTVIATNAALPFGANFLVQDRFRSTNEFNGGQVGYVGEWRRGRWLLTSRGSIAVGNTRSEVSINGSNRVTVPGSAPVQTAGGLLAQQSNIGTYTRDEFSIVPESAMTVGYQVTNGVRLFAGYSVLYWTNVTRAGDQMDTVVNATQIPPGTLTGSARPSYLGNQTDFWAQGFSFGLEVHY